MLKTKNDVFEKFINWLRLVENQVGTKVKFITARESVVRAIGADNGGEHLSNRISKELEGHVLSTRKRCLTIHNRIGLSKGSTELSSIC